MTSPATTRSRSHDRVHPNPGRVERNPVADDLKRRLILSENQAAHLAERAAESDRLWDRRVEELEHQNNLYSHQVQHMAGRAQEFRQEASEVAVWLRNAHDQNARSKLEAEAAMNAATSTVNRVEAQCEMNMVKLADEMRASESAGDEQRSREALEMHSCTQSALANLTEMRSELFQYHNSLRHVEIMAESYRGQVDRVNEDNVRLRDMVGEMSRDSLNQRHQLMEAARQLRKAPAAISDQTNMNLAVKFQEMQEIANEVLSETIMEKNAAEQEREKLKNEVRRLSLDCDDLTSRLAVAEAYLDDAEELDQGGGLATEGDVGDNSGGGLATGDMFDPGFFRDRLKSRVAELTAKFETRSAMQTTPPAARRDFPIFLPHVLRRVRLTPLGSQFPIPP